MSHVFGKKHLSSSGYGGSKQGSRIKRQSQNLQSTSAIRSFALQSMVFLICNHGAKATQRKAPKRLKIVPYDTLQAKVEIPSSQIGFVKVGMPADLSIDSFPATDFGVLEGEGKASAPMRFPQANKTIDLTIATQQRSNSYSTAKTQRRPNASHTSGNEPQLNIKLRKVSYLQLLLGTFQDKVDSLRRL